ncbi:MAG: DegT/DnrJ/EryC1/StrS family aminotransferase [Phycisphaerae bacterium]
MNKFIPVSEPSITEKEIEYVTAAVTSGWVSSLGEYIDRFEKEFAHFVNVSNALTVSNGTVALHLALLAARIGKDDEVIVPDLTFVATANTVIHAGAKPVIVDIDPETWCIDPRQIEKALTSKTKAIIPVHLYGHPADMDPIMRIAEKHRLIVIEDCAEAHGATYKGKRVGAIGHIGTFSFYGNKIITTGEGGMLTTNDSRFYERAKFLKDHAMSPDKRYWHPEVGYNYRMTNVQAAMGVAQLERIETLLARKREIFSWYRESLAGVPGIKLNPQKEYAGNVYWMICLLLDPSLKVNRDQFMKDLKSKGIDTRPFFYPMTQMPMYQQDPRKNPVSGDISRQGINLPSSVKLTFDEVTWISEQIRGLLQTSPGG